MFLRVVSELQNLSWIDFERANFVRWVRPRMYQAEGPGHPSSKGIIFLLFSNQIKKVYEKYMCSKDDQ
jgi:hypothetical protein